MELGTLTTTTAAAGGAQIVYFVLDALHPDAARPGRLQYYYVVSRGPVSYAAAFYFVCHSLCDGHDTARQLRRWHALHERVFATTTYDEFVAAVRAAPRWDGVTGQLLPRRGSNSRHRRRHDDDKDDDDDGEGGGDSDANTSTTPTAPSSPSHHLLQQHEQRRHRHRHREQQRGNVCYDTLLALCQDEASARAALASLSQPNQQQQQQQQPQVLHTSHDVTQHTNDAPAAAAVAAATVHTARPQSSSTPESARHDDDKVAATRRRRLHEHRTTRQCRQQDDGDTHKATDTANTQHKHASERSSDMAAQHTPHAQAPPAPAAAAATYGTDKGTTNTALAQLATALLAAMCTTTSSSPSSTTTTRTADAHTAHVLQQLLTTYLTGAQTHGGGNNDSRSSDDARSAKATTRCVAQLQQQVQALQDEVAQLRARPALAQRRDTDDATAAGLMSQLAHAREQLQHERHAWQRERAQLQQQVQTLHANVTALRRTHAEGLQRVVRDHHDAVAAVEQALRGKEAELRRVYDVALQHRDVRLAQLNETLWHVCEAPPHDGDDDATVTMTQQDKACCAAVQAQLEAALQSARAAEQRAATLRAELQRAHTVVATLQAGLLAVKTRLPALHAQSCSA